MIEEIYEIYKSGRKLVEMSEGREDEMNDDEKNFFADLKVSNVLVQEKMPDYAKRYEDERK